MMNDEREAFDAMLAVVRKVAKIRGLPRLRKEAEEALAKVEATEVEPTPQPEGVPVGAADAGEGEV